MRVWLTILLGWLVLMVAPLSAAEMPPTDTAAPVDLEADQLDFDQATGRYHARGQVLLTQGTLELTSDELWWNQQTGEVEANGNVRLSGPGEKLSGTRIRYNLQQGTGVVEAGEAFWQEKSLRLSGAQLERLGPNRFRILDGRITVCDAERPAWSVGTSEAEVTVGRYAVAKHALIYVKDVPAFYLPYLVVPVKTERESGFLLPRIGFSDKRGTELSTAWYQVIAPNQDATFFLDHFSELGTGVGAEYRYLFEGLHGELKLYNIFMRQSEDRRSLAWQQVGEFSERLRAVVDAELVDSRDYYRDFAEETGEYNRQSAITTVFVNGRFDRSNLTASYKYIKDLESANPKPWEAAPQVDYSLVPQRLGRTPLFVSLDAGYSRFESDLGPQGERLRVRPEIALHRNLLGLEFDASYGYQQLYYLEAENGQEESFGADDVSARLSGRLYRSFHSRDAEWLHSVEPEINYRYAGGTDGPNWPDFDRFDQFPAENQVGYALVNRLVGKWRGEEGREVRREVAWLRISQAYQLRDEASAPRGFSILRAELILRPSEHSLLDLDLSLDTDAGELTDTTIDGRLDDGKGNWASVTYHKREPDTGVDAVDNMNFRLESAWLKPVYLGYQQRYDFLDAQQLEQVVDFDYRQQCWGVKLSLREREEDRSIILTLTLGGIGKIGKLGSSL